MTAHPPTPFSRCRKLVSAVSFVAFVTAAWCAPATAAKTCEETLAISSAASRATSAYDCQFVDDTGNRSTGCLRFSEGTVGDFDIQANITASTVVGSFNGGCSCGPKGALKDPDFDAAKTFDCLPPFTGVVLAGKAANKKIAKGHITRANGATAAFTCEIPKVAPPDHCPCLEAGMTCSATTAACCGGLRCQGIGSATCQ